MLLVFLPLWDCVQLHPLALVVAKVGNYSVRPRGTCHTFGAEPRACVDAEGLEAYTLFSEDARSKSVTCSHLPGQRFFL